MDSSVVFLHVAPLLVFCPIVVQYALSYMARSQNPANKIESHPKTTSIGHSHRSRPRRRGHKPYRGQGK